MSTIVVVRKGDAAAIAADTLTKWGATRESAAYIANPSKLLAVGESVIAIAGSTTARHMLAAHLAGLRKPPVLDSVGAIFAFWIGLHAAFRDNYYLNTTTESDDTVESSRFDALIAGPYGIFGVSPHRTVQEFTRFYAYGSGCEYALGALYALYGDPTLDVAALAVRAIEAAAEFHDATGLPAESRAFTLRS
jgi:ATP-dependent protease HslVU (ClpYQ) peptidase subunit